MKRVRLVLVVALLFPFVSFAFDTELKQASSNLAELLVKSGKKSVAVVDFLNLKGEVTDGGRLFAEEFTVNLAAAAKGFKVIERNRLKTILDEYKLAATGIIDEKTAQKLGQIAGVDAIVTGTVTPLGETIRLSVKVLAVDTAQVIAAGSTTIIKSRDNAGIWNLFPVTSENPQPAGSSLTRPTTYAKTEAEHYSFELRRCQREGNNVVCDVIVTYTGREEVTLSIYNGKRDNLPTRAADNSRQEYMATMVQLGNIRNRNDLSYTERQSMSPRNPVVATVIFNNIPDGASSFSLFEIGCESDPRGQSMTDFVVQFRNVPIAQDDLKNK